MNCSYQLCMAMVKSISSCHSRGDSEMDIQIQTVMHMMTIEGTIIWRSRSKIGRTSVYSWSRSILVVLMMTHPQNDETSLSSDNDHGHAANAFVSIICGFGWLAYERSLCSRCSLSLECAGDFFSVIFLAAHRTTVHLCLSSLVPFSLLLFWFSLIGQP